FNNKVLVSNWLHLLRSHHRVRGVYQVPGSEDHGKPEAFPAKMADDISQLSIVSRQLLLGSLEC
ncbi:hypothetical protein JTE90_007318, partial [Oedothorax gibbosus]